MIALSKLDLSAKVISVHALRPSNGVCNHSRTWRPRTGLTWVQHGGRRYDGGHLWKHEFVRFRRSRAFIWDLWPPIQHTVLPNSILTTATQRLAEESLSISPNWKPHVLRRRLMIFAISSCQTLYLTSLYLILLYLTHTYLALPDSIYSNITSPYSKTRFRHHAPVMVPALSRASILLKLLKWIKNKFVS